MSKPSDYFVGIVDLFSILLPGSIAVAILLAHLDIALLSNYIYLPGNEASQWIAFLITAYFVGHVNFALGALLDHTYDFFRQFAMLMKSKRAWQNQDLYEKLEIVKKAIFTNLKDSEPENNYQWSKSILIQENENAMAEVNRLEADSKLFRSLTVITFFALVMVGINTNDWIASGLLLITIICYLRYYERRLKSNSRAYLHVINMHQLRRLIKD